MKTTLNIDDTVMAQLKREAARQKRTMSELVEMALRGFFRSQRKRQDVRPLPTFQSGHTGRYRGPGCFVPSHGKMVALIVDTNINPFSLGQHAIHCRAICVFAIAFISSSVSWIILPDTSAVFEDSTGEPAL
jgi:hypothetical protein